MSYDAFKVVHLFGVVLFLGNIIVTAVWKVMADQTGDPRIVAYAKVNFKTARILRVSPLLCA